MRRPLSSWNMVLSSSQERSHMLDPTSSAFWPIMFVVMEGLTSMISVLSLTMLPSSAKAEGGVKVSAQEGTQVQDNQLKQKRVWFLVNVFCRHLKDHYIISQFRVELREANAGDRDWLRYFGCGAEFTMTRCNIVCLQMWGQSSYHLYAGQHTASVLPRKLVTNIGGLGLLNQVSQGCLILHHIYDFSFTCFESSGLIWISVGLLLSHVSIAKVNACKCILFNGFSVKKKK